MVIKKRGRRKMTVEELFNTDWYRSIIALTDIFAKTDGLRQLHYRWALIKNHDNMKYALFVKGMQQFFDKEKILYKKLGFSNKLERLYAEGILVRDCITSNSNLSNFLKRLSNPPYTILEHFERDGVPRYKLTEYGKNKAKRWQLIQLVKGLDDSIIEDVYQNILKFIEKKMYENIKIVKKQYTVKT
jgi:hypothetical protein